MAILLFFACLIALFTACFTRLNKREGFFVKVREAFIYAALIYAAFVFVEVQILSAFDALDFPGVFTAHALLLLITLRVLGTSGWFSGAVAIPKITKRQLLLISVLALTVFLPLLYQCVIVPPNNSDASTCYLIRTEYWIKNGNILPYPTQNLFETYYNRFPQFFTVNTRLLSGGDYFSSLFQFFSYVGAIVTTTLITRELGGRNPKVQLLAGFICLSIPQAILQSSAAMYDLQSAFAASVAILFFIRGVKNPQRDFLYNLLLFSIAFSLTSYIKYSAVFFLLFFPIAACVYLARKKLADALRFALLLTGIFLAVHLTFFYQNYRAFGSVLSPENKSGQADHLISERWSPGAAASGIIKNFSVNLVTPVPALNDKLYNAVLKLHEAINTGINDPQINLNAFYEKYSVAISESTTGNLFTTLLFFLALVVLFWRIISGRKNEAIIYIYLICLFLGFILFSGVFKFQSWNARLQLPFYVLLVPPMAVLLSGLVLHSKKMFNLLTCLCLAAALPYVYLNYGKPLLSYRTVRQFANKPPALINATEFGANGNSSCLGRYYHTADASSFIHLKSGLTAQEKKEVFRCLDSVNYFRNEKSVFEKSRNENYLVPGYENSALLLSNSERICRYLYAMGTTDTLKVALIFGHAPEYPLIAMLRDYPSTKTIVWEHIQYYSLPRENRNFRRTFFYDAIVTNDSTTVRRIQAPVKKLSHFGLLDVIELEKSDSTRYRLAGYNGAGSLPDS